MKALPKTKLLESGHIVPLADPNAIVARQGGTHISRDPAAANKARKIQEQANQWRKEHGLVKVK